MPLEIFEHLVVGALACNCYVVGDPLSKDAIVIDPGDDPGHIIAAVDRHGLKLAAIVATHGHFDHLLAADALRTATGALFYMHDDDRPILGWMGASMQLFLGTPNPPPPPEVDRSLIDGEALSAGGVLLEVMHTPGHSPGSVSLVAPGEAVFSGDTLFSGSVGRTDLPGGSDEQQAASIHKRLFLLEDLPVYPGHGPPTSIDREKAYNPFVGKGGLWTPDR